MSKKIWQLSSTISLSAKSFSSVKTPQMELLSAVKPNVKVHISIQTGMYADEDQLDSQYLC